VFQTELVDLREVFVTYRVPTFFTSSAVFENASVTNLPISGDSFQCLHRSIKFHRSLRRWNVRTDTALHIYVLFMHEAH